MNSSLFETSALTPALRQSVASITPQDPVTDDGGSLLGVAAIVSVSTRERLRKKPANISGHFSTRQACAFLEQEARGEGNAPREMTISTWKERRQSTRSAAGGRKRYARGAGTAQSQTYVFQRPRQPRVRFQVADENGERKA